MKKGKPKRIEFTPKVTKEFNKLKELFITAPVLKLPNPTKQVIVEVDAAEVVLGPVRSQVNGEPGRLYPCDFFSRKLRSAGHNYDIGNHQLLAVKAALEEWCHWLEGACQPFTYHSNLKYIQQVKCLNPHQARRVLLFTF